MTDPPAPADPGGDEPEARPDWLARIAYFMKPRPAGRIVLVHSGADARLRELVLALVRVAPDLRVLARARPILEAPERSAILLAPAAGDGAWLNQVRPVFEQRALRALLWCDRATVGRLLVEAPDFMHWVSHAVVGPRGLPAFAIEGVRCALRARAPGIAWRGPMLDEVFRAALPGRRLRRLRADGGFLEKGGEVRRAGAEWVVWTDVDTPERARTVEEALAFARRRTRTILVEPAVTVTVAGFWPLHARTMGLQEACGALEEAGAQRAGRLAVLADLEPEAIGLLAELLRAGVPEAVIEPALAQAADPGAEVGWMALERGIVRREDALEGRRTEPPLLRALARRRAFAARAVPETLARSEEVVIRALREKVDMAVNQPLRVSSAHDLPITAPARQANTRAVLRQVVEALILDGISLHEEGRYADMLRTMEKARDGARALGDVALEVRAARLEGDALRLLGFSADALTRYSWVLGIARDPANQAALAEEEIAHDVLSAFLFWTEAALSLPSFQVNRLFEVLDAAEDFVRSVGRPAWRAGVLLLRATMLGELGRTAEAIGAAEEGLALARAFRGRDAQVAMAASLRWRLGHLLRQTGRFEEAQTLYRAVLDDSQSHPGDRLAALRGLRACRRAAGDLAGARGFADEAARIAEPMGDAALSRALADLTDVCLAQGDLHAAHAASEQLLRLADRLGIAMELLIAHHRAAEVALAGGDAEGARAHLAQAAPHAEALDRARGRSTYRDILAEVRGRLESLAQAPPAA